LKHLFVVFVCLLCGFSLTVAQQADLTADNVTVVAGADAFGQPISTAVGALVNGSDASAYTNISLHAKAYDADDALIGEGIGVLVNACGVGLLSDFALQPGESQLFSAPLELSESDAVVARVEISAEADPTDAAPAAPLADGIRRVTSTETVNVEWIDERSLRFATGCENDLFTSWTWYTYNIRLNAKTQITTLHAADVDETMRQRLQLEDDAIFTHSMMRFVPDGDRLVYQNERNDFLTAYKDGRYRRGLYTDLHNRSLQGIYWLPQERFLAYYYGAYGDPVYYFIADAESRVVSPPLARNPPSLIVPGASSDGRRVVVAGDFSDGMGYYLYVVTNGFFEKLFEAPPPGNNYPAPLPLADPDDDLIHLVYVALPVDGAARLQCFNRDEGVLHDLAPLPLNLSDDERAWWWIAPDESKIALAATGVSGGLWLIDLAALPPCQNE